MVLARTARDPLHVVGAGVTAVVVVDLVTKLVAHELAAGHRTGLIVPVRNPELSLGIASAELTTMIVLSALGIVVAASVMGRSVRHGRLTPWIPIAMLGGALGNLIDRFLFGSVHDFVATPWIVFNVADVAVVAGLLGLLADRRRRVRSLRCGEEVIPCTPSVNAR